MQKEVVKSQRWKLGTVEFVPIGWEKLREYEKAAYERLDVVRPILRQMSIERPELFGPKRAYDFKLFLEKTFYSQLPEIVPYFMPSFVFDRDCDKLRLDVRVNVIKPESIRSPDGRFAYHFGGSGSVNGSKVWYSHHALERMRERLLLENSRAAWYNATVDASKRARIVDNIVFHQVRFGPVSEKVFDMGFPFIRQNGDIILVTMLAPGMHPVPSIPDEIIPQFHEWSVTTFKMLSMSPQERLDLLDNAIPENSKPVPKLSLFSTLPSVIKEVLAGSGVGQ